MITHQVHEKFKVLVSAEGVADHAVAVNTFAKQLIDLTKDGKIAAKSVGIEFIESSKRMVLSLGYRDDVPGYPVKLTPISLGVQALDPAAIEKAMSGAAASAENVICHEFYVTDAGEFVMVLLSHG